MSNFKIIFLFLFVITFSACRQKSNDKFTDTYSSGTIKVAVDVSFSPIISEEIKVFQAQFPEAKIVPIFTSETEAIDLFLKDSVRVAITTRPLNDKEIKYLKDRTFCPRSYKLATDGLALIVNKSNPDTLMCMNDLRSILKGEVKNWNQLYPSSKLGDIKLVFDNQNSSTVRYAIDSICYGQKISDNVYAQGSNKEVIKFVSKMPNAIGVIAVNWLNNVGDSSNLSFNNSIRVMSVSSQPKASPDDSYKPYQAYLFYENYPLSRSIYVLFNDPKGSLPTSFTHFMTSDRGQRIILKSGLVPATQPIRVVNVSDK